MIPFRAHHLLTLLRSYAPEGTPVDRRVHHYFRMHKSLGSKDRLWIAEAAYSLIRWQKLWDALGASSWEERLALHELAPPESYLERADLTLEARCSFPDWLLGKFTEQYGEERAFELAIASNSPAPLTIRVNRLKGGREELMALWEGRIPTTPCKLSDVGLVIEGRRQLLTLPEYQEGWFELQDEASQWIAQMVGAKAGEEGLDYCAGSGGKTLAIAAEMGNKGQIYLHDVRPKVLYEARKRMRRAGVQNAQPLRKGLSGRMDWVLVDAPCSGTGTLRRNPDAKWRLTPDKIGEYARLQREIVREALPYLSPEGRLIYVTCSLLEEENGGHLPYFKELGLGVAGEPFQSFPQDGGMDGFYGVVLTRCRSE